MSQHMRIVRKQATGEVILSRVKWCESFICHFKGLQLASSLSENEGVLFVHSRESRSRSIHMLFMRFSIGVIWLDQHGTVVDKKLAKPWRLMYAPKAKSQYYIEAMPSVLDRVEIGDKLTFDEIATN